MRLAQGQGHRGKRLGPLVTTGRAKVGDKRDRDRRAWAEGKAGRGLVLT